MEWTHENLSKWFDSYFEEVRKDQGDLKTVPNLKKYFAPDMELMMYTGPSGPKPMSLDALLISFVHPGLHEDITPRCYVIDLKQLIVAVQFEIGFADKPSGKVWPRLQASAHYHLVTDKDGDLKIRNIFYWTEALPEDLFDIWAQRRNDALTQHALNFINTLEIIRDVPEL